MLQQKNFSFRFRSISTAFYRGAVAALVVFDLTNQKSFVNLEKWIDEIKKFADTNAILMLVGLLSCFIEFLLSQSNITYLKEINPIQLKKDQFM